MKAFDVDGEAGVLKQYQDIEVLLVTISPFQIT